MKRFIPGRQAPSLRRAGRVPSRLCWFWAIMAAIAVGRGLAAAGPVAPIISEQFAGPGLNKDWTPHVAPGNTVSLGEGLELKGQSDSAAYVERKMGADLVRIAWAARPAAASAGGALRLSWDDSNFIEIGFSPPGSSRIVAREVLGTYPHYFDLGETPRGEWTSLAVELAQDCVRFLIAKDGRNYELRRVTRRPTRISGAPALLRFGWGAPAKVFPPPRPCTEMPPSSKTASCGFRNLVITRLSLGELNASLAERQALERYEGDEAGEWELAAKADPSFESVSLHFPAIRWSREVVGVKGHPNKIGVAADGSLQFTADIAREDQPRAWFDLDGYRFGSKAGGCAKQLWKGYLPIVVARDRRGGLDFEQIVFGYAENFSPDEPLFCYVQMRVRNPGSTPRVVNIALRVAPGTDSSRAPSWELRVPAGESRTAEVRLPYAILNGTLSVIGSEEFASKLGETAAHWEELIAAGSRFEIPEKRVQDAYRAWIGYNFLNVTKKGSVHEVHDGSGFYTQVYGYSAALYCNALDLLGYHEFSAQYLDSLLTFMQPNGLLAVNFGDTDTGAALWTLSEHYRLTRDAGWLRRVAPKMLAMCAWITDQRAKALARGTAEPTMTRGLIRYRPYADLLHPAADYFSNGYLQKGLDSAASVLADAGLATDAERLKRAADEYLRDIRKSMDLSVFTNGGMRILPLIPDTRELWKESDGSANGYYGIIAPCLLEAGIPAANDAKAMLLVRTLERRGGLTAGLSRFHDMVDHAYTYGYWINCLQRDDVKRAILGLYGSLAYGMSRDTYDAVECTPIQTGENYWMLPHTYSNTQQLRLLRNMLLREDGDALWLGQAIPRPWLEPGKRVVVTKAPSLFGPVSYTIEAVSRDRMRATVHVPGNGSLRKIYLRLRHPEQRAIWQVSGSPGLRSSGDRIILAPSAKPITFEVGY